MAEMISFYDPEKAAMRLRVRTKNALGDWDWLADGETGKPIDLTIPDSYLQRMSDPASQIEILGNYMKSIAGKASVLENAPW